MKKGWIIAISVLVALLVVSMAKDLIIKISVEKGVEIVTGLKLDIRGLNVGIFRTAVSIQGLRVFNPPQFKDRVMVDMPEVYVNYDLPAMFGGTVHLRDIRINLKEFVVVKNKDGKLNLNSLKVVKAKKEGAKPAEAQGGKVPNIRIDNLELKIGKVLYKDYSSGGAPSVKEFDLNLNERYTNIDNPYALVSIIVVKALMNTTIAGLANFDLNSLQGPVMDTLLKATKINGPASDIAKQVFQTTGDVTPAVKDTGATVQKAAGAIEDLFKDVTKSDNK